MQTTKSKGNMYDFVDMTWNPLAGECQHRCSYCYVNKLKNRFKKINDKYSGELRLDEKEMNKNLGRGKTVFVCSCNDIFQNEALNFTKKIADKINENKNNIYILQTKSPLALHTMGYGFGKNVFLGVTLESNRYYEKIMGNCITPTQREIAFQMMDYLKRFITVEPILDFDLNEFAEMLINCNVDQINIGADSGNNHLPEPSKEKISGLIEILKNKTSAKIVLKSTLDRLIK